MNPPISPLGVLKQRPYGRGCTVALEGPGVPKGSKGFLLVIQPGIHCKILTVPKGAPGVDRSTPKVIYGFGGGEG